MDRRIAAAGEGAWGWHRAVPLMPMESAMSFLGRLAQAKAAPSTIDFCTDPGGGTVQVRRQGDLPVVSGKCAGHQAVENFAEFIWGGEVPEPREIRVHDRFRRAGVSASKRGREEPPPDQSLQNVLWHPEPLGKTHIPRTDLARRSRAGAAGQAGRSPRRPRGQYRAQEEPRPHDRRSLDYAKNRATAQSPAGASEGRRGADRRPDRRLCRPRRGSAPSHHRSWHWPGPLCRPDRPPARAWPARPPTHHERRRACPPTPATRGPIVASAGSGVAAPTSAAPSTSRPSSPAGTT